MDTKKEREGKEGGNIEGRERDEEDEGEGREGEGPGPKYFGQEPPLPMID